MEVHFTAEVQAKLEQMARDTGRRSDELVENVVTDFFEDFAFTRATLESPLSRSGKRQGQTYPRRRSICQDSGQERGPPSRVKRQ
jgi:hypothetical protein